MFVYFLRVLGVTPNHGKTGKREAAWALVAIALGLTVYAMAKGPEMVTAASGILVMLWPAAILAVAGAYKLEHDKVMLRGANERGETVPDGWPRDIAAPGEPYVPGSG